MEAKNLKFATIVKDKDYQVLIAENENDDLTVSVKTSKLNFILDNISPENLTILLRELREGIVSINLTSSVNS
jgi:hypothetical protein